MFKDLHYHIPIYLSNHLFKKIIIAQTINMLTFLTTKLLLPTFKKTFFFFFWIEHSLENHSGNYYLFEHCSTKNSLIRSFQIFRANILERLFPVFLHFPLMSSFPHAWILRNMASLPHFPREARGLTQCVLQSHTVSPWVQ